MAKPGQESTLYCPLPPAPVVARGLANGKYRFTEIGLERRCPKCGEWWPADTEFFYPVPSRVTGLNVQCKACYQAWRREKRQQRRKCA